jgi:hypothetical protein
MATADSPEFGQQLHEAPAFGHTPVAFVPPPGDHERIDALARAILAGEKGLFDVEFAGGNVPGPTILLDPPPDAIAHPTLRFLFDYWRGLPCATDLPGHARIDPVEMRPALGYILLLDVLPSGDDFVYRLYGSGIAGVGGQDWTGWSVAAMAEKTKSRYGNFYRAIYRGSLLSRRPIYSEHCSPRFLSARAWQRIVMPLVDGTGAISRFLVGNVPVGRRALTGEERAELVRRVGPDKN